MAWAMMMGATRNPIWYCLALALDFSLQWYIGLQRQFTQLALARRRVIDCPPKRVANERSWVDHLATFI